MAADTDLQDRVTELERRAQRLVLAGDDRGAGWGAWQNLLEIRLMEERDYVESLMTEVLAQFRRNVLDEVKAMLDTALPQRIRGTYNPHAKYSVNDVVAKEGGSFIARKNNPGPCPGDDWQLLARQGARGIAGPPGGRGPSGRSIVSWKVDRQYFLVIPIMSDGKEGPALELRALFGEDHSDAA